MAEMELKWSRNGAEMELVFRRVLDQLIDV